MREAMLGIIVWTIGDIVRVAILAVIAAVVTLLWVVDKVNGIYRKMSASRKKNKKGE